MRSPPQVRAALQAAARRYGDEYTCEQERRWAVIKAIEQAWSRDPLKVRADRRRSVLRYLFGQASTKTLSDAHIAALHDFLLPPGAPLAELRACLAEAMRQAGQAEMTL